MHSLRLLFLMLVVSSCGDNLQEEVVVECTFNMLEGEVISELDSSYAQPILSISPDSEASDIDNLISVLGVASVVGLGEGTHGSSEFFEMKDKIFRSLVKEHGFDAIVFEIPWGNCMIVDEFVTQNIGSADEALDQTWYWVYDTQETRDLAEWMHSYNQTMNEEDKIHFVGCDPQGPDFEIEKEIVLDYVDRFAPAELDSFKFYYSGLPRETASYPSLSEASINFNMINTGTAYYLLESFRDSLVPLSGSYEYEVSLMASHVIHHRAEMYRRQSYGQTRDSLMAIYTQWWQRILPGDSKVAVWAHNYHVMDRPNAGSWWMGSYLRESYGEEYKNVGFSFALGGLNAFLANGNGEFLLSVREQILRNLRCGTVNTLFHECELDDFYIIFDEIPISSEAHEYFHTERPLYQMGAGFNPNHLRNYIADLAIAEHWDVWIHFDEVTASTLR